jgi:glutamyl-Q tRNA(Asp) synthetase
MALYAHMRYTGRFAPSPTGPLHFGSLVAALASWLDARTAGGVWLLRMEDLDKPREVPGAADAILRQLEALGLEWDGPVLYQSTRIARYAEVLDALERRGATYPCGCTRSEIADSALAIDGARIYPGTCRGGLDPGRHARATRVRTVAAPIRFVDRLQGEIVQSVEREVGDFVLRRADGLIAYQLAVVVDDADQGVTDVVRGADLLDSTARQIWLQRLLGYPTPRYLHLPVAVTAAGEKLSKQTGAQAVDAPNPLPALARALDFLGQPAPDAATVVGMLREALERWDASLIRPVRSIPAPA